MEFVQRGVVDGTLEADKTQVPCLIGCVDVEGLTSHVLCRVAVYLLILDVQLKKKTCYCWELRLPMQVLCQSGRWRKSSEV